MGYLKTSSTQHLVSVIKTLLANKVDKADGYELVSDENVTQISANANDIANLTETVDKLKNSGVTLTDDTVGTTYTLGIDNGLLYYETE